MLATFAAQLSSVIPEKSRRAPVFSSYMVSRGVVGSEAKIFASKSMMLIVVIRAGPKKTLLSAPIDPPDKPPYDLFVTKLTLKCDCLWFFLKTLVNKLCFPFVCIIDH